MSSSEFKEIKDNSETRTYFDRFRHIGKMLGSISQSEAKKKESTIDDHVVLGHINKLNNTLAALQSKYWFNGIMDHRQKSVLMIDVVDSGFPLRKEITQMSADIKHADEFIDSMPTNKELKDSILDYALAHKKVNKESQYDLGMLMYYKLLKEKEKELFMPVNKPVLIAGGQSRNGNKQYIAHWSVYDVKKNIPNIYVMGFEYSGKTAIENDASEFEKLLSSMIDNSRSELKLVTIGMNIDKEFSALHPKSLKRVHVGPVYNNGVTKHNDSIQSVLDGVKGENNNWVFGWSVETLLSKGQQESKSGLFGGQLEEIFHVDSSVYEAFDAGATEIDRSMIIPYEVYQSLTDAKDNPLNSINKYVVNDNGEVIFL